MKISNKIPGGWYGNDPGWLSCDEKYGNVVIDPKQLIPALEWLTKRAVVLDTKIVDDGIGLAYRLKR